VFITNTGNNRRLKAQPCRTAGNIGGTAADVFVEVTHIVKTATNLPAVQINGRAPNSDEIKFFAQTAPGNYDV
jgi:hypothetical protein